MNRNFDLNRVQQDITDRYPQWSSLVEHVSFEDRLMPAMVANDGRTIYYNSRNLSFYTPDARTFLFAQQLLHIQLAHFQRGIGKDPILWRKASDAVVNAMLRADGWSPPGDAVFHPDAAEKSAEDLYTVFLSEKDPEQEEEENDQVKQETDDQEPGQTAGEGTQGQGREVEDPGLATAIDGLMEMLEPSLELDFDWFPGDTIRDGMIRDSFRAYPVAHAEVLVDTSISVDEKLLRMFLKAVKGILKDAVVKVGCFDTQFYGFHEINSEEDVDSLELRGAGGTDFTVAVNAFSGDAENQIIFTDGYAEMPDQRCDAVWIVYGNTPIQPKGGRVLYVRDKEEHEKHEIDFLIT